MNQSQPDAADSPLKATEPCYIKCRKCDKIQRASIGANIEICEAFLSLGDYEAFIADLNTHLDAGSLDNSVVAELRHRYFIICDGDCDITSTVNFDCQYRCDLCGANIFSDTPTECMCAEYLAKHHEYDFVFAEKINKIAPHLLDACQKAAIKSMVRSAPIIRRCVSTSFTRVFRA